MPSFQPGQMRGAQHPADAANALAADGEPTSVNRYEAFSPDASTVRSQTMKVGDWSGTTNGMLPTSAGVDHVSPDYSPVTEVTRHDPNPGDRQDPGPQQAPHDGMYFEGESNRGGVIRAPGQGSLWHNPRTGGVEGTGLRHAPPVSPHQFHPQRPLPALQGEQSFLTDAAIDEHDARVVEDATNPYNATAPQVAPPTSAYPPGLTPDEQQMRDEQSAEWTASQHQRW